VLAEIEALRELEASAPDPVSGPANHQKQVMAGHLDGP